MATRTRRTNILPLADIRKKVEEKCVEGKLPTVPDATRNAIIDYAFQVLGNALRNKNRKSGDFLDVPGVCRITIHEAAEKLVRAPRDNNYSARGATRILKFKVLKSMSEKLTEKFAQKPSQGLRDEAEKRNKENKAKEKAAAAPAKNVEKKVEKKPAKP